MENESEILVFLIIAAVIAAVAAAKAAVFLIGFNKETRIIAAELRRAENCREYHYWRYELRCHYLCLIPFVNEKNVMRLYRRLYRQPKHREKKRDDGLNHILAPSFIGIIVCSVCLCGASWAWFTASQSSSITSVKFAEYAISVEVNGNRTEPVRDDSNRYSIDIADEGEYSIKLSASGTAKSGYAVIYFADNEDLKYYTEQIPTGTDFEFRVNSGNSGLLQIETRWGSCALENITLLINNGNIGEPEPQPGNNEAGAENTADFKREISENILSGEKAADSDDYNGDISEKEE